MFGLAAAPAAKAAPAGPIGDPSAMKLVVPANDPAALKCLIAASAGGIAVYQVAGEVRVYSDTTRYGEGVDEAVPSRSARLDRVAPKGSLSRKHRRPRDNRLFFTVIRRSASGTPAERLVLLTHHLPPDPTTTSQTFSAEIQKGVAVGASGALRYGAFARRVPSVRYGRLSPLPARGNERSDRRKRSRARRTTPFFFSYFHEHFLIHF